MAAVAVALGGGVAQWPARFVFRVIEDLHPTGRLAHEPFRERGPHQGHRRRRAWPARHPPRRRVRRLVRGIAPRAADRTGEGDAHRQRGDLLADQRQPPGVHGPAAEPVHPAQGARGELHDARTPRVRSWTGGARLGGQDRPPRAPTMIERRAITVWCDADGQQRLAKRASGSYPPSTRPFTSWLETGRRCLGISVATASNGRPRWPPFARHPAVLAEVRGTCSASQRRQSFYSAAC